MADVEMVGVTTVDGISTKDNLTRDTVQLEGAEWVELLLREMQSATSTDDARYRATRVLESLEKSISVRASAEAAQSVHKVLLYVLMYAIMVIDQCFLTMYFPELFSYMNMIVAPGSTNPLITLYILVQISL